MPHIARPAEPDQRIDKWLWHARFVKTRTLAQKLVTSGGVRVDRSKVASASFKVKPGHTLTLSLPRGVQVVRIVAIAERRGPYEQARQLYEDITPLDHQAREGGSTPGGSALRHGGTSEDKRPSRDERRKAIRMKRNFAED